MDFMVAGGEIEPPTREFSICESSCNYLIQKRTFAITRVFSRTAKSPTVEWFSVLSRSEAIVGVFSDCTCAVPRGVTYPVTTALGVVAKPRSRSFARYARGAKDAPVPKPVDNIRAIFGEGEGADFDALHPSRQGFLRSAVA